MKGETTKVSVLVSLFNWMQRSKSSAKKRSKFRKFIDTFCDKTDYFTAIRLILPSLDRERGSYGLKESVLATCLIDALGISRDSPDALRLINWRKSGSTGGVNAGNFPLVAAEVLQRRQGMASGGLTIKELNDLLDRLASSENRAEKTDILSTMIQKTNAQEMKWIIMIILKDLKLGISEKSIFLEFHPDAEDLFNVTCDLKLVCEKLRDPNQRHKRQDIEVGKAVRPQLATRVGDATTAWKKLQGKEVVVECKFDGDRIQIHKNGAEIHYYSRNFLDHSEYDHAMSNIIEQNVLIDRCILDGEMLVWDTSMNCFAEFGSNQETAKAARDGFDSDRQLCYIAFDILYVGDTSVIHQSLKERHELLRKVVKPLKGRLDILLPDDGLNTSRPPGEPCWSLIAYDVNDVERFFKETVENRDEGIVLKDLGSRWDPGDRGGKWLKLKPDYIRAGSDLDVLIIGGYYGSGRRGGEVAQFLVGLAEHAAPNAYPRRKYEYPKKGPPSFYQVTNNSKERPDVWVESPEKSIILSITSDIRTIRSEVFAAPYGLRFPRIDRVRYDKPWHECLDMQSFVELVHSSNGTTQKDIEYGGVQDSKPKRMKSSTKREKQNVSVVPNHFVQTDISDIKGETLIFSNMMFYFVNVPPTHSLDSFHKMVVENGGTFSMNLNNSVSHCVAAESKGIKYQAAKLRTDIIHYSWVLDCCLQKKLIHLHPKYFLHLSDSSKKKFQEDIDEFADSYYWDLDTADLKQLLSKIDTSEDSKTVDYYKKKYCPTDRWSRFHGCCIYFYPSMNSLTPDSEVLLGLVLRRLKLEVLMGGGKECKILFHATHLVVLSVPGSDLDFSSLMKSFTTEEKHLLLNKRLHVVGYQWLEDCLKMEEKLPEDGYSMKPRGMEVSAYEECKDDLNIKEASSDMVVAENLSVPYLPDRDEKQEENKAAFINSRTLDSYKSDGKRKRGRPVGQATKKRNMNIKQARRMQTHCKKKPAKIHDDESDTSSSADEKINEGMEVLEDSASSQRDKQVEPKAAEESGQELQFNNEDPGMEKSVRYCSQFGKKLESRHEMQFGNEDPEFKCQIAKNPEKCEAVVDPVHAMLLDMIPSLGIKKNETAQSFVGDDKVPEETNTGLVKKKKVSYKDVASELLKDW
ncbi:DNA ligase 4 isoform X2 [Tripterygium wilfordii]|uniref:DNA ligase 4 isoform X2 n=1 Tax=Tripterygium wilfordii TaxID=458696 RepID=UPI0018F831F2|nr:DNA ligase 4 isoform X2 [Tripterygium wilfordii]